MPGCRGGAHRKEQRIAARLAREAKARDKRRQAAHFAMIMGIEGDGNITLVMTWREKAQLTGIRILDFLGSFD